MAKSIYKFEVYYGRMGSLQGTFTAEPEDIAFALGKTVYFDEPFGKHSSAQPTLAADQFTLVSSDPAEVATFERLDLSSGDCPLGLLHDSISDGAIELTEEEAASAPAYFKDAVANNAERMKRYEEREAHRPPT